MVGIGHDAEPDRIAPGIDTRRQVGAPCRTVGRVLNLTAISCSCRNQGQRRTSIDRIQSGRSRIGDVGLGNGHINILCCLVVVVGVANNTIVNAIVSGIDACGYRCAPCRTVERVLHLTTIHRTCCHKSQWLASINWCQGSRRSASNVSLGDNDLGTASLSDVVLLGHLIVHSVCADIRIGRILGEGIFSSGSTILDGSALRIRHRHRDAMSCFVVDTRISR